MSAFADDRAGEFETITAGKDETGLLAASFSQMITSIKARDQKLAHHMDTLEDTIEERTHDLNLAKTAAEEANAAKSDFLATMSHEIRTPMNGMLVMAEMLSSADLSTHHRRYAEIIARSGNSLLTIINDILDMSKIESGKLELETCAVSLDTLVTDAVMLFWERAREKDVELVCYVSSEVPAQISADPTRLNQIITNLINNALKFTDYGNVQIHVTARPGQASTSSKIIIEVKDTGIGIPKDKLETIFDAFSQADQSTTRRFGGTGLGLSVCRKLADAMGGTVSASSQLNKGSTFCLELECDIVKPAPVYDTSPLKVDVQLGNTASALTLIKSLEEAACTLTNSAPDLTITDSSKLQEMATLPSHAHILLSDVGDMRAGQMLRNERAVDLLPNPFTRRDLTNLLKRAENQTYRGINALTANTNINQYPDFKGLRVLAADDNAVNREVLREALLTLNVDVDFAENGRQAAEMVRTGTYNAVFMDGSMPEMDGFEATRSIRVYETYENLKPTPIIALTAQMSGVTQDAWKEAGAQHYIAKPFTLERLSSVLSTLAEPDSPDHLKETINHDTTLDRPEPPLLDEQTISGLNALGVSSGRDLRARVWSLAKLKTPEAIEALIELSATKTSRTDICKQVHALKSMALSAGLERLAMTCEQVETDANNDAPWHKLMTGIEAIKTTYEDTLIAMEEAETSPEADIAERAG